jgi:opacity protein-like surface antigen
VILMSASRFLIGLAIFSSLWAAPLLAQDLRGDAVPAAEGSTNNFAVGFSYANMNLSGQPTVNLKGVDSSAVINFLPRWGATLDASYARAGRDPGSGHSSYLLNVLTGPVFAAAQNENTRLLVRALAGVGLVDSSVRVNQLYYRGWQSRFSWAIGTGVERNLSTPFAVRFNVDYLRTKFVGSAGILQPQNGIRVTASLVLRFAAAREPRHVASMAP